MEPAMTIPVYLGHYAPCPTSEKARTEHALGRALLARGLRELYRMAEIPALEEAGYGKPFFPAHPDLQFSISHCDGLAGCAFADVPIGLDLEKIRPFRPAILRKVLTQEEQEIVAQSADPTEYFFRFWTLKESRIKQAGRGLSMPLTDFSFTLTPLRCSEDGLCFSQQLLPGGYVLALCAPRPIGTVRLIEAASPTG